MHKDKRVMIIKIMSKSVVVFILYSFSLVGYCSPLVTQENLNKIKFTHVYSNIYKNKLGASIFPIQVRSVQRGVAYGSSNDDLRSSTATMNQITLQASAGAGSFAGGALIGLLGYMMVAEDMSLISENLDNLNDQLNDVNIKSMVNREIKQLFTTKYVDKKPLNITDLTFISESEYELINSLTTPGQGSVLLLSTGVILSKGFKALSISTIMTLILDPGLRVNDDDSEEEDDNNYPIMESSVVYLSKVVPDTVDPIQYWSKGGVLKEEIEVGVKEITKLIQLAVDNLQNDIVGKDMEWEIGGNHPLSGKLLNSVNGRDTVYASRGWRDFFISLSSKDRFIAPPESFDF